MIEKGKSNNKSLYLLLGAVMLVLAGTAYGIFSLFLGNATSSKAVAAPTTTAVAQETTAAKDATAANSSAAKDTTAAQAAANTKAAPPASKAPAAATQTTGQHDYRIVIKKSEFKLYVLDNGAIVETFGCALGKKTGDKEKSGDMKTPNGTFTVAEVCDASYWTHDFKDGKGEIKGAYGPWFFYLDTNAKSKGQWDGIGIHGTHDPASIGTLASEGCIRLLNENVQLLKDKYIKVGTKVTIEE